MSKHIHDETDRNKQVKFRASKELVDELDETIDISRAEWLRQQIAAELDADDGRDEHVPNDQDLAEAYQWLLNRSKPYDGALVINFGEIKGDMSEALRVAQDTLKRRYLRKLRDRGFIGQPRSGRFEVKPLDVPPRSASTTADADAVATDGGEDA